MNHIRSLAGGYKENSPKVRSENSKKPFVDTNIKTIDTQNLIDNIKNWYTEGKITSEGLEALIIQLSQFVNAQIDIRETSLSELENRSNYLHGEIQSRGDELNKISQGEDIISTINALKSFFGEETINKIKNQNK